MRGQGSDEVGLVGLGEARFGLVAPALLGVFRRRGVLRREDNAALASGGVCGLDIGLAHCSVVVVFMLE